MLENTKIISRKGEQNLKYQTDFENFVNISENKNKSLCTFSENNFEILNFFLKCEQFLKDRNIYPKTWIFLEYQGFYEKSEQKRKIIENVNNL